MLALKNDLLNLTETLQDLSYLATVDKAFIQQNYKDLLATAAHYSLEGLTDEQVNLYFSMKEQVVSARPLEREE